ncbi:hypothetical protein HD806DRAFT_139488 [Xylariaceae sp. AK1471]|nr:hypothetical protein HD806DRAFT_139488 [Xylariaceae sp. AK1471]
MMDSRGIEPRTTPKLLADKLLMLREYYTTKPQARGSSRELLTNRRKFSCVTDISRKS